MPRIRRRRLIGSWLKLLIANGCHENTLFTMEMARRASAGAVRLVTRLRASPKLEVNPTEFAWTRGMTLAISPLAHYAQSMPGINHLRHTVTENLESVGRRLMKHMLHRN